MTDTEVLDWLEQNMEEYLVVPPHSDKNSPQYCPEWSIYKHGDQFDFGQKGRMLIAKELA